MKEKILIVDDEQDILEFVSYNLKKEGFEVFTADNSQQAIELALKINPHIILLDVMLPGIDGIEICGVMRELPELKNTIIAFLTARAEDYSQIAGFDAGADDYITKPVRPKVLISRIKALLKRFDPQFYHMDSQTVNTIENQLEKQIGNVLIDLEKYTVLVDGSEIYFTKKEFVLLQLLTSRPSKVFTREEIFECLWKDDSFVGDRTIDVYVSKLREKLGDNHIKTIKGVGYKFE